MDTSLHVVLGSIAAYGRQNRKAEPPKVRFPRLAMVLEQNQMTIFGRFLEALVTVIKMV